MIKKYMNITMKKGVWNKSVSKIEHYLMNTNPINILIIAQKPWILLPIEIIFTMQMCTQQLCAYWKVRAICTALK